MTRLAIVGGGIAGLGAAYCLRNHFDITIYEKNDYFGGHANTVVVPEAERQLPIDTGFMVFNHATYPNLIRLFEELGVPEKKTDMSFSVQQVQSRLEFSGASFERLFGDLGNLFNLRFWRMLLQIDRFNKEGAQALSEPRFETMNLTEYVKARGYGDDFLHWYLVPMSSALWSAPPATILDFPIRTLLQFFSNHGLLGVSTHHQWWTVDGGSVEYVKRLMAALPATVRLNSAVSKVRRDSRGVVVVTQTGGPEVYDQVILACHADEALGMLDAPSVLEQELLGAFAYQRNETLLHTDSSVMPKQRRCWASWNYRLDANGSSTHYWMNSLQQVSRQKDYFVTLNGEHLVDKSSILKRMTYHHPIFDLRAMAAQKRLWQLNENDQVFFCGSYFAYGFHEDALASAVRLAELLRGRVACR